MKQRFVDFLWPDFKSSAGNQSRSNDLRIGDVSCPFMELFLELSTVNESTRGELGWMTHGILFFNPLFPLVLVFPAGLVVQGRGEREKERFPLNLTQLQAVCKLPHADTEELAASIKINTGSVVGAKIEKDQSFSSITRSRKRTPRLQRLIFVFLSFGSGFVSSTSVSKKNNKSRLWKNLSEMISVEEFIRYRYIDRSIANRSDNDGDDNKLFTARLKLLEQSVCTFVSSRREKGKASVSRYTRVCSIVLVSRENEITLFLSRAPIDCKANYRAFNYSASNQPVSIFPLPIFAEPFSIFVTLDNFMNFQ